MKPKLLIVALCCGVLPSLSDAQARRPNVLFMAVDDLRVELGCYGCGHVKSPHIDRLATQGTLFTRAYCQQTVCNPSRASVLTGLRLDTLRVWDLPTHFRQHRPNAVTLPQLFKESGYHAEGIGKIFHNWRQDDYRGDPESWSVPAVLHYNSHYNDKPLIEGDLPPDSTTLTKTECRDVPDDAYFDGRVADEAIQALRRLRGKPFFLAVGFWKPHLPFNAPKKYWGLYDRSQVPLPVNMEPPVDVPDLALTEYEIDGRKKKLTSDDIRELHHGHLAAISYLDAQVGRVLDELGSLGLRQDTIVVFWSDHGLHLGEHGLWSKTTVFELDARVPLIIAAPHRQGGQRTDAIVELLDLYPTLTDLCGLRAPDGLEGASLTPLLNDPSGTVKAVALTQAPRPNYLRGKLPEIMGYSVRSGRFRYTEWRDFRSGQVRARELYNHQQDPGETVNVINDKRYAKDIRRLAEQMRNTVPSAGDLRS